MEMKRVRMAMLVLVATATAAAATDIPVGALKLIMVDKMAASGSAKTSFVIKDGAVTKGVGEDTSNIFAEMGVAYDSNNGSFQMPMGASWIVNKSTVAKYVNKPAPSGGGVKVSVIKPSLLVKMAAKSTGDTPLDISSPPTGSVYATYILINNDEGFRYCTKFDACVYKVIAGGGNYKLVCKNGIPDSTCAGAPPPACCAVASIASCGYLDPFLCAAAGGVPGAANSVCDSVTGTCLVTANDGGCCANVPGPAGDICLAGPFIDNTNCSAQGGTFVGSSQCQPDASCN
jgi:hypothetical protein